MNANVEDFGERYYYVYRSAVTGQYVSKAYAEEHPDTCIRIKRLKGWAK